jgi:hypothetical protein
LLNGWSTTASASTDYSAAQVCHILERKTVSGKPRKVTKVVLDIPSKHINKCPVKTVAYLKASLLELEKISERTYRRAILTDLKMYNQETTAHSGHTVEAACSS